MGSRVEQAVRRAEAAVAIGATRVGDVSAAEFNASQAAINELMELVAKQDAELAALKARRCDGCKFWRSASGLMGRCESEAIDTTAEPVVHADFYCAAWEPQ